MGQQAIVFSEIALTRHARLCPGILPAGFGVFQPRSFKPFYICNYPEPQRMQLYEQFLAEIRNLLVDPRGHLDRFVD